MPSLKNKKMLQKEHIDLIAQLVKKTAENAMVWEKGLGRLSYQSVYKNRKFLIDKYFASVSSESAPCLNLAIFNDKNALESEIVLCDGMNDQKGDYTLLNDLYTQVSGKVPGKDKYPDLSLLSSITHSLMEQ
jgi:hypothetical protein